MPHLLAAILILIDRPHPDKQEALALACAVANQLQVIAVCHRWEDCLPLFTGGHVSAIVAAVDPGDEARAAYESAGVRLFVAREQHVKVRGRDVNQLAVRMHARGLDSQEISQILEAPLPDVRAALRRARRPPD